MDAQTLKSMIKTELDNHKHLKWYGAGLSTCLIEPIIIDISNSSNDQTFKCWLVFEEQPLSKDGYKIIYDVEDNEFGLAIEGNNNMPIALSWYGNFVDTLENM
jgi:hypothetical protein